MLIVHVVFIALFIVLGIIFMMGKGAVLIAGYNTSGRSERQKYDEKALCKFMGKSMFALSACWFISALSEVIGSLIPLWIGIGLFVGVICFMLIYANTGNRFKKQTGKP